MGVGQLSESDAVDALRLPFYSSSHPTGSHGWRNQFDLGNPDLELMREIDRQYMLTPFYGSRRIVAWLKTQGYQVNRKRVQRLMRTMGLEAIYRRPRTSQPVPGHKVYHYLLRGVEINRVNQAWTADITYIPMAKGFLYVVAIMDWYSRYVLSWRVCPTLWRQTSVWMLLKKP